MDTPSRDRQSGKRAGRLSRPLLLVVLALGGIAIVTLAVRDDTPRLTREAYEAARARWEQRAIPDYTLEVLKELDRQAPERLRTEIRGGRPTSLTVNAAAVRTTGTYSVQGLFDIIERELEMAATDEKQPGQPGEVTLRALFDAETGRPLVFKRLAGRGRSVILTATSFEVASPSEARRGEEE